MLFKDNKTLIFITLISSILVALPGCIEGNTGREPALFQTAAEGAHTVVPSPSVPDPTATSAPPTLFLAGSLPDSILLDPALEDTSLSNQLEASLWFGPAEGAPQGNVLSTSTWVYALTAPFPTLRDDTSLNDLRLLWRGHRLETFTEISYLYIPDSIVPLLSLQWGSPSPKTTIIYQPMPDIDRLWEENSWAIVPFESLDPKLKVISIAGLSPLFKDFSSTEYPFAFEFHLIQNPDAPTPIAEKDLQNIIQAIQPTNRDPDKMTTLVMTGVTALVRATAAKMEEKGILYPGEEIRHWLTEADLTHISNEVSFYEDCPPPDPQSRMLLFCSDPKYVDLFMDIGADIIELTGNHNNDSLYIYGKDVVPYTLDLYDQYGMQYFGGGRDLTEAKSPLVLTHNGNQFAFLGCNAPGPDFAWATADQGGAAPCGDYQWMVDEIKTLRQSGVLPIATFQYYEDYYNFAEEHHVRDFGRIAEAGAVIVNGSQAHRPKAMAFEYDAYIDYGLGNLFFDQMGIIDDYGNQILQTRWEKIQRHTFYDGRHLSTELLTAMLYDYAQPRPMTLAERLIFLSEIFAASGWDSR